MIEETVGGGEIDDSFVLRVRRLLEEHGCARRAMVTAASYGSM